MLEVVEVLLVPATEESQLDSTALEEGVEMRHIAEWAAVAAVEHPKLALLAGSCMYLSHLFPCSKVEEG